MTSEEATKKIKLLLEFIDGRPHSRSYSQRGKKGKMETVYVWKHLDGCELHVKKEDYEYFSAFTVQECLAISRA